MHYIKKLFEEKHIHISLHCYDENNFSTAATVQYVIDNQDIFDDFCVKYPLIQITNLEDFYLYLLYEKLASLHCFLPKLNNDNDRAIVKRLSDAVAFEAQKIQQEQIIRFHNTHYKELFIKDSQDLSLHEMQDIAVEHIGKYSSGGIDLSVLFFLCENYGYMVIDEFDLFEKAIEKNAELFEKLYPTGSFSEINGLRYSDTLKIWAHLLEKKDSPLRPMVTDRIETLYQDIVSYEKTISLDNAIQEESLFREFLELLQKVRNPRANDFEKVVTRIKQLSAKALLENGQVFSFEVPIGLQLEKWKGIEDREYRLILLTHQFIERNGKKFLDSILNSDPEKKNIVDAFRSNIKTNEYYTFSHQFLLNNCLLSGAIMLNGIINNRETLVDYCTLLFSAVAFVEKEMHASTEHLQDDCILLINMIIMMADNKQEKEIFTQPLCYSVSMFSSVYAEKLLRIFYRYLARNDIYIPETKIMLGQLLKKENLYINSVFGENHIMSLSFFYLQTPSEHIGLNYRNKLAHWSDVLSSDMTILMAEKMLWLFTDVLNTIVLYFDRNTDKENSNPQD